MGILDALDRLVANADPRSARPADPTDWPTLNEPLHDTDESSFDLGQIVDRTNADDAGGYPAAVPADLGPFRGEVAGVAGHECESCKAKPAKVRRLVSARYVITADDVTTRRSLVVTPSGVDADDIRRVTLVASDENAIRFAGDMSAAEVGAYLPPWFPVTVEFGPVWIVGFLAAATVDVVVEYES